MAVQVPFPELPAWLLFYVAELDKEENLKVIEGNHELGNRCGRVEEWSAGEPIIH